VFFKEALIISFALFKGSIKLTGFGVR